MATRSTPAPRRVTLDLDALEREDSFEPFVVKAAGVAITLTDIRDLDWQVAASISPERLQHFFRSVVPEDQWETFIKAKFPRWKMEKLLNLYRDHYGLGDEGN